MSFFQKSVADIVWDDLADLIASGVAENVRLEFKSEVPGRSETLKKLSSFANTYGGDLIIGAMANVDGILEGLPGVPPQPNLKQTLVQWCYGSVTPPVEPLVSSPIEVPEGDGRVVFVVRVTESRESPHFLNGRKGCYVRTDEFSHHFEPRLATYEDISHLASRRALALTHRQQLMDRAEARFDAYVEADYEADQATVGPIGATLKFWVTPAYPTSQVVEETALENLLRESRLDFGGTTFPFQNSAFIRQHESVLAVRPLGTFSIVELSVWGSLFYAVELERTETDADGAAHPTVFMQEVAAYVLLFIQHASQTVHRMGYEGSLLLAFRLERIRGVAFQRPRYNRRIYDPWQGEPTSRFDDAVAFQIPMTTWDLLNRPLEALRQALRTIGFSVNWAAIANDDELARLVTAAYGWNQWTEPEDDE